MEKYYDYVITKPDLNEDTLTHYGVKGMKWKRRKGNDFKVNKVNGKGNRSFSDNLVFNNTTHETANFMSTLMNDLRKGVNSELLAKSPKYRKLYKFMHTPISAHISAHAQGESNSNNSHENRPLSRKKKVTNNGNTVYVRNKGTGHNR